MAMTHIELMWGGGRWNGGHKKAARPFVESALGIADDSIDYFHFNTNTPKTAVIWQCSKNLSDAGSVAQNNTSVFEMYIPYHFLKHRKLGRFVNELAVVAVHEVAHTIRNEFAVTETLADFAVSEGLAYHAEQLVAKEILSPIERSQRDSMVQLQIPPELEQYYIDACIEDMAQEAVYKEQGNEDGAYELYEKWFEKPTSYTGLSAGDYLGILSVGHLLASGAPLAEVIEMPTEEIFAAV